MRKPKQEQIQRGNFGFERNLFEPIQLRGETDWQLADTTKSLQVKAISARLGALHPRQVIESKQQGLRRLSFENRCRLPRHSLSEVSTIRWSA